MHRRARHLNPRAAGAVIVLDSRYITGLNDGDAVSTWSDRSGNGNDASQSTSGNRPVYKVGQQGGQPAVRFDGSNDYLTAADNSGFVLSGATVICSVTTLTGRSGYQPLMGRRSLGGTNYLHYLSIYTYTLGSWNGIAELNSTYTPAADSSGVATLTGDQTVRTVLWNGDQKATSSTQIGTTSLTSASIWISGYSPESQYSKYDFLNAMISSSLSAPLRRRLEHASAFSFKIACS